MVLKLKYLLALCGFITLGASFQYESYKVYNILPTDQSQTDFLFELSKVSEEYDFWVLSRIPGKLVRVMVPPKYQEDFEELLKNRGLNFAVSVQDVSRTIKKENLENLMMRSISSKVGFERYHRFDEINNYLDTLAEQYSTIVSVKTVGKSYEGRSIKTITVSNGVQKADKKVIFVDAGIHAREWIAPAEALYIIHQLVENHAANKHLLENFDWIILPVVNPDGYEYTHTKSRFWRKTRKANGICYGTDGNRNYDFHWGEVGTSSSPCSDVYRGPTAFSDSETQIVRDILLSNKGRCKFYLTLHSFGNYILYPWGWTSKLPETWEDLEEVSQAGAKAMRQATGVRYDVGSSTNVLYAAAGGSDDYAFAIGEVPIAITMELPGGGSGFDPSPREIKSMVEETWIGIKAMAEKVDEKYA